MLEFFKKIINKIFGTKLKLLEASNGVEEANEKNELKNETSINYENSENMFDFLTGIMESCDNYEEFVNSETRKKEVRKEMNILNEKLKSITNNA